MDTIKKKKTGFTMVPNALLEDDRLSPQARFIYCYLFSRPDNWKFRDAQLCKVANVSEDTLRKYKNELKEKGWIEVEQVRKEGVFSHNVYEINTDTKKLGYGESLPTPKKTDPVKNRPGKIRVLNNTEASNNTDSFEQQGKCASAPVSDVHIKNQNDFPAFVEAWFEFFQKKELPSPGFDKTQGAAMKEIIKKIKQASTTGEPVESFRYILANWGKQSEWISTNALDLKIFNSKFNVIISNLKNGSTNRKNNGLTDEQADYLVSRRDI